MSNQWRVPSSNPVVRTARGTIIDRYPRTGVGKLVGSRLYIHRTYVDLTASVFPTSVLWRATALFKALRERFQYNCLCLNLDSKEVRFDEAPDFNEAREPHVGRWLWIPYVGPITRGHSNMIWHHKWMWVLPGYTGFNVRESHRWSARYSPLLDGAPSGSEQVFTRQLIEAGLIGA